MVAAAQARSAFLTASMVLASAPSSGLLARSVYSRALNISIRLHMCPTRRRQATCTHSTGGGSVGSSDILADKGEPTNQLAERAASKATIRVFGGFRDGVHSGKLLSLQGYAPSST